MEDKINLIKKHIKNYPDFPKQGILFRDLFSVFLEPEILNTLREVMLYYIKQIQPSVECLAGLEARGFLFAMLAADLKIPFVPIRKKGKLPGKTIHVTYDLEYGQDILEIQEGSIKEGSRVVIVDDLLATGGSLNAGCKLIKEVGGNVVSCLVVMEMVGLQGCKNVPIPVQSLIHF